MNLYRKYRPTDFDQIIGNKSEIEAFEKALSKPDRPHVFLLTGPSGCGKTTLARIAAKKLGADEMSITEINGGDNRGIDDARRLKDTMPYIPTSSSVSVYILDEAHGVTKEWKRSMLKPLEDTPEHVYFFLCTTDPKKLTADDEGKAIKTRCTQVKVSALDENKLYKMIFRINMKEKFNVPKEILQEISENCQGSPRMALVLLEKVSQMEDTKAMKEVISMGEAAEKEIIDICRALIDKKKDWGYIAEILKGLKGVEPEKVRYAVLGYMNSVLLNSGKGRVGAIIEIFSEPFYNSGKAGLTLACFQAYCEK